MKGVIVLNPGVTFIRNNTGKPEWVLPADWWRAANPPINGRPITRKQRKRYNALIGATRTRPRRQLIHKGGKP